MQSEKRKGNRAVRMNFPKNLSLSFSSVVQVILATSEGKGRRDFVRQETGIRGTIFHFSLPTKYRQWTRVTTLQLLSPLYLTQYGTHGARSSRKTEMYERPNFRRSILLHRCTDTPNRYFLRPVIKWHASCDCWYTQVFLHGYFFMRL